MEINRRNFLKLSGAGVAGTVIVGNVSAQAAKTALHGSLLKPEKIIYRNLGRTGIKLPIVSMGAMNATNSNLITTALDAGIVYFDTAHSYQEGRSEEMLGDLLKSRKRDSFVIATKINTRGSENPEKDLTEKFEKSLQRLQMDYVDILFLHGPGTRELVLDEKTLKLFQEFKKQGKTKFIGISIHRNIPDLIKAAIESKVWDVVLTSYNFRMQDFEDVKKSINEAAKAGIGVIAMKTMAGGYWDKEKTKKINTTAALKWVLLDENVTTAIPGCSSFEQIELNIKLLSNLELTEQEQQDLKSDGTSAGLICVGCEQCVPQCPNKVPIPDLMRAFMYAYGYSNPNLAREVVDNLSIEQTACNKCPICNVECRLGFDIQGKAKDILRIREVPKEFLV
jgi:predicted aldo/keto reductase-like oxidoreductase